MTIMFKFFSNCVRYVIISMIWIACMLPLAIHGSDFLVDFWWPLASEWWWWDEKAFTIDWLSDDASLLDNLKSLFYPDPDSANPWWALRDLLKNIAIWLLLILFVWAWAYLMFFADNPEDVKTWLMNLLYLVLWAIILFFALWLIWDWLDFSSFEWLTWSADSIVKKLENNVMLTLIAILKWIAFFAAIIFIIYYWYEMITAFDSEEKLKAARTWVLNVIYALLFIKILDYLYFITLQWSFKTKAVELVVSISKFLWYIAGISMVIMIIYAWYLMVTANWDDEQVSKAKNMVKTIFIAVLILMLFLLIIYQIFQDVAIT